MAADMLETLKEFIPRSLRERIAESPRWRRFKDRVAGRAYCCTALQGESNYNICINSDLTVSCNCRDWDGSGHIGDLRMQTLDEIFAGATARRFRETLARGRFPVAQCAGCWELVPVPKKEAFARREQFHAPVRGIMVENTVLCNLHCVHCLRERVQHTRRSLRMSLEDVAIVARVVREHGIQEVAFHNLGEPFLSSSVLQELTLIREQNPGSRIISSTNGILLNTAEKRDAALLLDLLCFSIDGPSQEVLTRYQGGGDFAAAYGNMRALAEARDSKGLRRPVIEWKYVVFSWNDAREHIEMAVNLAKEARVDVISFWLGSGNRPDVSRRFREDDFFKTLGAASWKGREIVLRPEIVGR